VRVVKLYGAGDIRVEEAPEPKLQAATDALVRVTKSAICGTDLHPYRGHLPGFPQGTILGHEFTGIVTEVGDGVSSYEPGDRVLISDVVADGTCWYCRRGWHYHCANRTIFGYADVCGWDLPGGQADLVRVPYADTVLLPIPDALSDEQVLFAGDILSTSYLCALNGAIENADTVAVIGCGPVGILAQMCAWLFGPAQIVGLDLVPERLKLAQSVGSIPIDSRDDPASAIRGLTDGRGADVVLECVGGADPLNLALQLVRPHGTISVVGAHFEETFAWPAAWAFDKEITLRNGAGNPLAHGRLLIELVRRGRLDPTVIVSHRMPIEQAAEAYALFDARKASKVILEP
jgi:2-desacetyl-2-hydroxyethyl bacteriochlorophyllide A dehydrogenase